MNVQLQIVILLLACVSMTQVIAFKFDYKDQSCTLRESRTSGLDRAVTIACKRSRTQCGFRCQYEGNPHKNCPEYNKNPGKYYVCLKDQLVKDSTSPCNPKTVNCPKICPDVVFDKEWESIINHQEAIIIEKLRAYEEDDDINRSVF